jgi:hypothetical protein
LQSQLSICPLPTNLYWFGFSIILSVPAGISVL